jgi:ATP-binding cassette subfamily A (ABC1) protein 3
MVSYLLTLVFVIVFLKLFGIDEFVGGTRWMSVLGLLILYGLAHIPQMYLLSYLFEVSATGFAFLVGWNILSSQVTLTPVQILSLPQLQLVDVSEILEWVFLVIFPNFCLGQSMIDLYENQQITGLCKEFVALCPYFPNPCCMNFNTTNPNKCGVGSDCLRWSENLFSWEK